MKMDHDKPFRGSSLKVVRTEETEPSYVVVTNAACPEYFTGNDSLRKAYVGALMKHYRYCSWEHIKHLHAFVSEGNVVSKVNNHWHCHCVTHTRDHVCEHSLLVQHIFEGLEIPTEECSFSSVTRKRGRPAVRDKYWKPSGNDPSSPPTYESTDESMSEESPNELFSSHVQIDDSPIEESVDDSSHVQIDNPPCEDSVDDSSHVHIDNTPCEDSVDDSSHVQIEESAVPSTRSPFLRPFLPDINMDDYLKFDMRGDGFCAFYACLHNNYEDNHPSRKDANALCKEVCNAILKNTFTVPSFGETISIQEHLRYVLEHDPVTVSLPTHQRKMMHYTELCETLMKRNRVGQPYMYAELTLGVGHAIAFLLQKCINVFNDSGRYLTTFFPPDYDPAVHPDKIIIQENLNHCYCVYKKPTSNNSNVRASGRSRRAPIRHI